MTMTTHLVTFSDESMSRAAQLCVESAGRVGGVDDSLRWYRDDLLDTDFYRDNKAVLDNPKGVGLWTWKPWIIHLALRSIINGRQFDEDSFIGSRDGDIVIYADAGIEFITPVQPIIDRMDQDVWLFGNSWEHAHWCKRDVIEEVWPYWRDPLNGQFHRTSWADFGKQVQASVIFFRVSDYTRQFVAEWLKWCLYDGGRLIDDSPSRLPNHPEFREHRHDQAILTTLAYREGIKLHYWPAVYNLGYPLPRGGFVYEKLDCYADDDYPSPLFHHHRRRNHEWKNIV